MPPESDPIHTVPWTEGLGAVGLQLSGRGYELMCALGEFLLEHPVCDLVDIARRFGIHEIEANGLIAIMADLGLIAPTEKAPVHTVPWCEMVASLGELSGGDWRTMLAIGRSIDRGNTSAALVAQDVGIDRDSARGYITGMMELGLVHFTPDPLTNAPGGCA